MSRVDCDYEPMDVADDLRMHAFEGNIKRAIAGKKGQKFLRELEAALLALPEKRLVSGVLAEAKEDTEKFVFPGPEEVTPTGEVCALGVVALTRALARGEDRQEALKTLVNKFDPSESNWQHQKEAAKHLKICHPVAYAVMFQNDECNVRTPEERYESVLAWVRRALKGDVRYYVTRPAEA